MLLKTDSVGNTCWVVLGAVDSLAASVQQRSDGSFVAGGSSGAVGDDFFLIDVSADGQSAINWVQATVAYEQAQGVGKTADGGLVVAGAFGADAMLMKLPSGPVNSETIEWTRTFGYPMGTTGGQAAEQTSDAGYILAGNASMDGELARQVLLVKTAADGRVEPVP